MSGAGAGTDEADRDGLAGEYVLGTLSAFEAAGVERAMATDPALARAVAEWERRLGPMAAMAGEFAPPPGLWDAIERRLRPAAPRAETGAPRRAWWSRLVAGWAVGATAVAAGLAGFVVVRGPSAPPAMTVLLTDRTQSAWTAAFDRDGALRLAAIPPAAGTAAIAPADRVLQLWVLPPGAAAPTSLGLLPRGQTSVTVAAPPVKPVPGMLIEISLEPPGGSTTGRPTGPVLFIGRLSQPGPNS